jgi:hypothetical protein
MEEKIEQETMALSAVKVKSYNSIVSWNGLKARAFFGK